LYEVTYLEEGLAEYFCNTISGGRWITKGTDERTKKYLAAKKYVNKLLVNVPDAILKIRKKQPRISLICKDDLQEVYPKINLHLLENLLAKFY